MDVQWTSRTTPDQAPQRANQIPPSPPKTASESQKSRFSGAVLLCVKQGLYGKKRPGNCKNDFYCWHGCWLAQVFPNLYFTLMAVHANFTPGKYISLSISPVIYFKNASRGIFVRLPIRITGNPKFCSPVSVLQFIQFYLIRIFHPKSLFHKTNFSRKKWPGILICTQFTGHCR